MSDESYDFDDGEDMIRNFEIEGKIGTKVTMPNGKHKLQVLAATDANPRWRENSRKMLNEINRLTNAEAPPEKIRHFWADKYARYLVIGWEDVTAHGVEVPFSVEACAAYLRKFHDAYDLIDGMVRVTKYFRGAAVQGVVDEAKN